MLLNERTMQQLGDFIQRPTHGLLLSGPEGSGKAYVGKYLASRLLDSVQEKLTIHPYFKVVSAVDGTLGIDQIRDLQKFLLLKVPGKETIRRVILVEDAQLMTNEAQNALLKALEEPPADTIIILTAPATTRIKETIYSRVQRIEILPADESQAMEYYRSKFTDNQLKQAYVMSGGHTGLLHTLLHDTDHQLAREIARAKEILGADTYHRMIKADVLSRSKDIKEVLPIFLQACRIICTTALKRSAATAPNQAVRWHKALSSTYEAEASLPHNPNTKLLLTNLLLNL